MPEQETDIIDEKKFAMTLDTILHPHYLAMIVEYEYASHRGTTKAQFCVI